MSTARKLRHPASGRPVTQRHIAKPPVKLAPSRDAQASSQAYDDIERISRALAAQSGTPANQWRQFIKDARNLIAIMDCALEPA